MSALPGSPAPAREPGANGARPSARRGCQPPGGRNPKPKPRPLPERSRQAKQRATAILEVLAGARTPTDAARVLGVSLARYYLLEEKALAGLVAACEPQPRGPGPDNPRKVAALERDCQRWQRECIRQQSLVRAAQRTIGLAAPAPPPSPSKDKSKKRRARRPVVRALQAAERLRPEEEKNAAGLSTAAVMES